MRTTPAKTRSLLEAAVKGGVPHFIFSSTAAVYGSARAASRYARMRRWRPNRPTACSKLMSEWMLRDAAPTRIR
jgi:UDP-glucose 4-epimerase